jgi:hypothetical protein
MAYHPKDIYLNNVRSDIQSQIDSISVTSSVSGYTLLTTTAAISANLQIQITNEVNLRNSQIVSLSGNYTPFSLTRSISGSLSSAITSETNSRISADSFLQSQINVISGGYAQIGMLSAYTPLTTTAAISAQLRSTITNISGSLQTQTLNVEYVKNRINSSEPNPLYQSNELYSNNNSPNITYDNLISPNVNIDYPSITYIHPYIETITKTFNSNLGDILGVGKSISTNYGNSFTRISGDVGFISNTGQNIYTVSTSGCGISNNYGLSFKQVTFSTQTNGVTGFGLDDTTYIITSTPDGKSILCYNSQGYVYYSNNYGNTFSLIFDIEEEFDYMKTYYSGYFNVPTDLFLIYTPYPVLSDDGLYGNFQINFITADLDNPGLINIYISSFYELTNSNWSRSRLSINPYYSTFNYNSQYAISYQGKYLHMIRSHFPDYIELISTNRDTNTSISNIINTTTYQVGFNDYILKCSKDGKTVVSYYIGNLPTKELYISNDYGATFQNKTSILLGNIPKDIILSYNGKYVLFYNDYIALLSCDYGNSISSSKSSVGTYTSSPSFKHIYQTVSDGFVYIYINKSEIETSSSSSPISANGATFTGKIFGDITKGITLAHPTCWIDIIVDGVTRKIPCY